MAFALYTGVSVDHVDDITFGDGLGWAFRQTGAAGDAKIFPGQVRPINRLAAAVDTPRSVA